MLKKIVLIIIILSITMPSHSAVSVNDGSAFVTKAEFAANTNGLKERMSFVENSLDAKIDSLVSSYLSRNGIWNGESQKFLYYDGDYHSTWFSNLVNPKGPYPYFTSATAGPKFTNINNSNRGKDNYYYGCNNMFELYDLFTSTKSGLCFFRVFIAYPTGSVWRMYTAGGKYDYGNNENVTIGDTTKTVAQAWTDGSLTKDAWNNLEKSQEPVQFIAYWFDKSYVKEYWGLTEEPVQGKTYQAVNNKSSSYEYIPKYAISTQQFTMPQDTYSYFMGSFFVTKGTTYSLGFRLIRGVALYDYNAANPEQKTGLYLGPVSELTSYLTNFFTVY